MGQQKANNKLYSKLKTTLVVDTKKPPLKLRDIRNRSLDTRVGVSKSSNYLDKSASHRQEETVNIKLI
jgi:hypothetical protein